MTLHMDRVIYKTSEFFHTCLCMVYVFTLGCSSVQKLEIPGGTYASIDKNQEIIITKDCVAFNFKPVGCIEPGKSYSYQLDQNGKWHPDNLPATEFFRFSQQHWQFLNGEIIMTHPENKDLVRFCRVPLTDKKKTN